MITYSNESWLGGLIFKTHGSVIPKSLLIAVVPAIVAVFLVRLNIEWEDLEKHYGGEQIKASQLWGGMTSTLIFLIGFRTNKAYGRFWDGTTLLHQMWGEWFDASSCLTAFSSLALKTKPKEVENFRHALIRLMSLCHASALEEIACIGESREGYPTLDLGGLDQSTLRYLRKSKSQEDLQFNRVEVLIHMIQMLVVHNQENGVIKIAPPILSRVFQTISRGQVNLANCKKITNTLFPFPYAQLIAFLLLVVYILTPAVMACLCEKEHWAFIFTMVPVFGLFAVNNVARELEMPFGDDANDLPLLSFQLTMNKSLLMLIRREADLIPHTSERCNRDFESICDHTSTARLRDYIQEEKEEKAEGEYANAASMPTQIPPIVETPVPPPPIPPVPSTPTAASAMIAPAQDAVKTSEALAQAQQLQTSLEVLAAKIEAAIVSAPMVTKGLSQNTTVASQLLEAVQRLVQNPVVRPQISATTPTVRDKDSALALSGCCRREPLPPSIE